MEIKKFRKVPPTFEAVRYTTENGSDLEVWCSGWIEEKYEDPFPQMGGPRWTAVLFIDSSNGGIVPPDEARPGDWIIKLESGVFIVEGDTLFSKRYEEIE